MCGVACRCRRRWYAVVLLAALFLPARPAGALSITLGGSDWNEEISVADVPAAGLDYTFAATYLETGTSQVLVNIDIDDSNFIERLLRWYVRVQLRDDDAYDWPAALSVYVIRTGDGTGSGGVNPNNEGDLLGPLSETTDTDLCNARRDRSNIPVQLRVDGFSVVDLPPGTYTVDIVYTVSFF